MQIVRGTQLATSREWGVTVAGRSYHVICYWSAGEERMSWMVGVEVSAPQVQTHWRRIKGQWLINAVREHENAATAAQR